jgi:O-antigen/teichoic acid export membrane protein
MARVNGDSRLTNVAGRAGSPDLMGQLLGGGAGTFAVTMASTALHLGTAVLLARVLGPQEYGLYVFVLAVVALVAIPAGVGLPQLLVRETARAEARGDWSGMRGLWGWATAVSLAFSGLLVGVGALLGWRFADRLAAAELGALAWGLVLVPLVALGNLRGAALRGLRRVVSGELPEHVLRPGVLVLLVLVAWWLLPSRQYTAADAVALHAGAAGFALLVGAYLLTRVRPRSLGAARPEYHTQAWLASAVPLALVAGLQVVRANTDVLMLGLFVDAEEVGIYRVGAQAAILASFGLQAANMAMAPHFARLGGRRDLADLERAAVAGARAATLFAICVLVALVALGAPALRVLFGAGYASAYGVMLILASAQLANTACGSVGLLLNMTRHEGRVVQAGSAAVVLHVVLNLVLIPIYGKEGAAAASGIALVFWNLVLWRQVHAVLGIESSVLGRKRSPALVRPGELEQR